MVLIQLLISREGRIMYVDTCIMYASLLVYTYSVNGVLIGQTNNFHRRWMFQLQVSTIINNIFCVCVCVCGCVMN